MGKTDEEIAAGLEAGVLMFNVESEGELEAIARVATAMNRVAPIALAGESGCRPPDAPLHLNGQEGIKIRNGYRAVLRVAESAVTMSSVRMIGMHMHIGSQITTIEPYAGAVAKGVELIGRLRKMGHPIGWYNMGGGFGIAYKGHEARPIEEFARDDRAGNSRLRGAVWRSSQAGSSPAMRASWSAVCYIPSSRERSGS